MASRPCASCLRMLQRSSRSLALISETSLTSRRAFTTGSALYADIPEKKAETSSVRTRRVNSIPSRELPLKLQAAASFRKAAPVATYTYTAFGVTKAIYKKCGDLAGYSIPQASDKEAVIPKTADGEDIGVGKGWWHDELGLPPTFSTWSQVTMLHLYLLIVRFRCMPEKHARIWQQNILDHFFYDAEDKMITNHGMAMRSLRNKYLQDIFVQWRGLLAAYDEGIVRGDAMLAAAVWRNVFKADENVDIKGLAAIVGYMRKILRELDALSYEELMEAKFEFGNPGEQDLLVAQQSKLMRLPLPEDDALIPSGSDNMKRQLQ